MDTEPTTQAQSSPRQEQALNLRISAQLVWTLVIGAITLLVVTLILAEVRARRAEWEAAIRADAMNAHEPNHRQPPARPRTNRRAPQARVSVPVEPEPEIEDEEPVPNGDLDPIDELPDDGDLE